MTQTSDETVTIDRPLAVVTGASSGIGLELAKQFAKNGFDLIVAAEDAAVEAAATVCRDLGAAVHPVQVDLATDDGVDLLVASVNAAGGKVDSLAVNAGVGVGGPFVETDLDAEQRLVALNVTGAVRLAKWLLPPMVERGHGRVLFTSSIAATMPGPFEAVYAASKAFVHSFAESLHEEVADSGVTVTSVMPGPTATNFFHRAGMDDTRAGSGHQDSAAEVAEQAYSALMAGEHKATVGSAGTKVMGLVDKVAPERLKAKAHRRLSEPGSGE